MPEKFLYINKGGEYHTGNLREASCDLVYENLSIVRTFEDRLENINPALNPFPTNIVLKAELSSQVLPTRKIRSWQKAEKWVTRMLCSVNLIDWPERVTVRMGEYFETLPSFKTPGQAAKYLVATDKRLSYLLSQEGQKRLDTLRLGCYAYTENNVLKKVIYERSYLAPIRTDI